MDKASVRTSAETRHTYDRELGSCRGAHSGPLLLCIAGLHGNEPAGIRAMRRVLGSLPRGDLDMRGDLIALAGNLAALERGRRFIDEDLNRVWQVDRVEAIQRSLRGNDDAAGSEDRAIGPDAPAESAPIPMVGSAELREQRGLVEAMEAALLGARGPIVVFDLHTTSSESAPFSTLGDTLANRRIALQLPIPVVLGLEEQIDGAMLEYLDSRGFVGIGIEGGRHDAEASVEAIEDTVWIALSVLGMLAPADVPDLEARRARLAAAVRGLPRVAEVRYRHEIGPEDSFHMKPAYANFQPVHRGEAVATDRVGDVLVPEAGRIFLPLYQRLGDDGFFIVRRVNPVWLRISAVLRNLRLDRFARWIPGVRPHPERRDAYVLAPWATNHAVIGVLHLLGFRKRRRDGKVLMIRRAEHPPIVTRQRKSRRTSDSASKSDSSL